MNFKQKILLVVGVILFISAGVYPNWINKTEFQESNREYIRSVGRHLIFDPPKRSYNTYDVTSFTFIDVTRLLIEWAVIVFPASVLFLVLRTNQEKK